MISQWNQYLHFGLVLVVLLLDLRGRNERAN